DVGDVDADEERGEIVTDARHARPPYPESGRVTGQTHPRPTCVAPWATEPVIGFRDRRATPFAARELATHVTRKQARPSFAVPHARRALAARDGAAESGHEPFREESESGCLRTAIDDIDDRPAGPLESARRREYTVGAGNRVDGGRRRHDRARHQ